MDQWNGQQRVFAIKMSIIFVGGFLQFLLGFSKVPVFCVTLYKVVEKIKTHIPFTITFFFFENPAFYEIMCKNPVEPDRPQRTI
jgi:hypothetical protein